jgi:hypothetical protein
MKFSQERGLVFDPAPQERGSKGFSMEAEFGSAISALSHCRLRLQPFMRRRNRRLRPTGGRFSRLTTNWYEFQPSPVEHLNRAMAIAMHDGREAGLAHIDAVLEHGELANYLPGAFSPRGYVPQAGAGPVRLVPLVRKFWC